MNGHQTVTEDSDTGQCTIDSCTNRSTLFGTYTAHKHIVWDKRQCTGASSQD